jgi:hypothetical protein
MVDAWRWVFGVGRTRSRDRVPVRSWKAEAARDGWRGGRDAVKGSCDRWSTGLDKGCDGDAIQLQSMRTCGEEADRGWLM